MLIFNFYWFIFMTNKLWVINSFLIERYNKFALRMNFLIWPIMKGKYVKKNY
jgi:hypothetical protein